MPRAWTAASPWQICTPYSTALETGRGPLSSRCAQRLALQQLEDGVVDAVLRADVVQGEHVRVAEGGDDARLLLEALQPVRIVGAGAGQDLDRDRAAEAGVDGAVHLAHASRAQGGVHAIRAETVTGRQERLTHRHPPLTAN